MRLHQLDGLRGILCLCVVYHHFLCGFHPCSVFGPSAKWIDSKATNDFTSSNGSNKVMYGICYDEPRPNFLTEPFGNGAFAVACFFVMSGVALSIKLISLQSTERVGSKFERSSDTESNFISADKYNTTPTSSTSPLVKPTNHEEPSNNVSAQLQLVIAKRFFRLALPACASIIFAYLVVLISEQIIVTSTTSGTTEQFHAVAAKITMSKWLRLFHPRRPPGLISGLIKQCFVGIWHGTSTLNNAIWTMPFELWGSFLIFLLIAVLPSQILGKSMKVKRYFSLLVLLSFTLMPSPKVRDSLDIFLDFSARVTLKNGTQAIYEGIVTVDPSDHQDLVEAILKKYGTTMSTSLLQVGIDSDQGSNDIHKSYNAFLPWTWIVEKDEYGEKKKTPKPLSIDSAKFHKIVGRSLVDEIILDANTSSTKTLYLHNKEDLNSSVVVHLSNPRLAKTKDWSASSPFELYSCFILGLWIAIEYQQQLQMKQDKVFCKNKKRLPIALLTLVTVLCASFPFRFGELRIMKLPLWSLMSTFASFLGLSPSSFYHILGAGCLIWLVVIESPWTITSFLTSSILSFLGKISFSLYLTHIPILYTVTSAFFVTFHDTYNMTQSTAANLAIVVSLPIMISVSTVFYKYVDKPSIKYSNWVGEKITGLKQ